MAKYQTAVSVWNFRSSPETSSISSGFSGVHLYREIKYLSIYHLSIYLSEILHELPYPHIDMCVSYLEVEEALKY